MKQLFYKILSYFGHTEYEKLGGVSRSPLWPKVRKQFLIDNDKCAVCGGKDKLEVHHIKKFSDHPELELVLSNLLPLCESGKNGISCHLFVGHLGSYLSINENVISDVKFWNNKLKNRP